MANKDRERAQRMASRGASVQEIRQATGLSGQAARIVVQNNTPAASPYSNMQINTAPPTSGPLAPSYQPPAQTVQTWSPQPAAQPAPQPSGLTYQGRPIQDGVTYQLNDSGTAVTGIAQGSAAPAASTSYKDIKNISQGLRIGGNDTISYKEALKISKNTGKSFDEVLAKGLSKGFNVSAKAANKSNKAFSNSSLGKLTAMGLADYQLEAMGMNADPLRGMRGTKYAKGYVYKGTGQRGGVGPGIIDRKDQGGKNPLTIGKGGSVTTPSTQTNTTPSTQTQTIANQTTEDLTTTQDPMNQTAADQQQQQTGPGGLLGGGLGAAGAANLRRKRGRLYQMGIQNRGTSLLGRGLQYGNSLNK